ncbi:unnamed protein product [Rotaria sp. Silwood1]|nr:unnamed protein product [Rotaria sp. Silwood1]CAF1560878.1 unnamed protein product [Rotaria sp. Silwood1]CAF3651919.1 unnamed protein product [Rotaria sp. Silwood1]CAF4854153.1 unnamed protein product [Rotaria sp. Silwood1]
MSVTAFAEAFRGRLSPVKKFLEEYPEWKDKSGLWQTTLLYSAARHGQLDIIQYLIEEANCSINAQNQRQENDITEVTSSTALHRACSLGHLSLVKYFVEHGADYFIRNQMDQTPIMAGKHHANIQQYFQDYLIIKYSMDAPSSLPDCTFSDDSRRPMADGWWEYKPIRDPQWYKFSKVGAAQLREALLPFKEFQEQVYLSLGKNYLYYISMIVEIDNYQPMTNLEPIPLTTKHLRDVVTSGANDQEENISRDDDVDDDGSDNAEMADIKDIDDVDDDDDEYQNSEESTDNSQSAPAQSETAADPSAEAFFHPTVDKIEKNTVVTIATSTGSGKSTLLPALLIAEGYDRVCVTQPRRLPCTSICNRVNKTMMNIKDRFPLAGWSVSGAERNTDAQILYLTDGLLKERLLFDSNFIENEIRGDKRIVLFVDEVHERSINIDLCLALIARLLTEQPSLRLKLKVIISSATLDKSVPTLFHQIPQLKFDQYQMPFSQTLHKVEKIYRPKENILDVVQELCRKRQRHDQILCFVSSVTDVYQYCSLLDKLSRGIVIAHPLVQSQSANEQQRCIEHGTIFFSTTVAETSLTFPSLKYVVDTGMINVPIYDPKAKQTTLKEVPASESTIKQRLGRLGRTKPGEYHALYDSKMERRTYPKPHVCQSNLIDVEFSLRRSSLGNGLSHLKKCLPDPPESTLIEAAVEELKRLGK